MKDNKNLLPTQELVTELLQEVASLEARGTFKARQAGLENIKTLLYNSEGRLLRLDNPQVHLSASGVVLIRDKILFVEHPFLKMQLLPAGHVEPGERPLETAIREFNEETGYFVVPNKIPDLIDINLISIPENEIKKEKAHWHIDFRYRLFLSSETPKEAELPTFLLAKQAALPEFRKYFEF